MRARTHVLLWRHLWTKAQSGRSARCRRPCAPTAPSARWWAILSPRRQRVRVAPPELARASFKEDAWTTEEVPMHLAHTSQTAKALNSVSALIQPDWTRSQTRGKLDQDDTKTAMRNLRAGTFARQRKGEAA
eukprot:2980308-Prymnesium_polylepis.1